MPIVPLDAAEAYSGITADTLKKYCQRGEITGLKRPLKEGGTRLVWWVDTDELDRYLGKDDPAEYEALKAQWVAALEAGTIKGKPLGDGVTNYKYGINRFWERLGLSPKLRDITPQNLMAFYALFKPDNEQRKCFYSQKRQTANALLSFLDYCVIAGKATQQQRDALAKVPLRRLHPPRRTSLPTPESRDRLLLYNLKWTHGRSEVDIYITDLILRIGIWAGLRRKEMARLKLSHIDWEQRIINVIDGKGQKDRMVYLEEELAIHLVKWIDTHRPKSAYDNLLVSRDGKPLSTNALNMRLVHLREAMEKDGITEPITMHGLRRTFVTRLIYERKAPMPVVARQAGHAKIETTKSYIMDDDLMSVNYLKEN